MTSYRKIMSLIAPAGGGGGPPITDQLIHHWDFSEGSGTTLGDRVDGGFDLPVTTPIWGNGPSGGMGALDMTGIADNATKARSNFVDFNSMGDWTITSWAKIGILDETRDIVGRTSSVELRWSATGSAWQLQLNAASGGFQYTSHQTAAEIDAWTHVVGTYDATTREVAIFIDGVKCLVPITLSDVMKDVPNYTNIGTLYDSRFWVGSIGDVRIYNRVLTHEEIERLSNFDG